MICKLCNEEIGLVLIVEDKEFCPLCQKDEALEYVNSYNNKSWFGKKIHNILQWFK